MIGATISLLFLREIIVPTLKIYNDEPNPE